MLWIAALAPWAVIISVYTYTISRNWEPMHAMGITALIGFPTVIVSFFVMATM